MKNKSVPFSDGQYEFFNYALRGPVSALQRLPVGFAERWVCEKNKHKNDFLMKIVTTLFVLIFLTGCGTAYIKPVKLPSELENLDASIGYIAGSVSFSGSYPPEMEPPLFNKRNFRFVDYGVMFHGNAEDGVAMVGNVSSIPSSTFKPWYSEDDERDFEVPEGLGYTFLIPLQPGSYEFTAWRASASPWYCVSDRLFDWEFEVKTSEVTYLGEIRFKHNFMRNSYGYPTFDCPDIIVLPMKNRDLPILHQKFKQIESYPIINAKGVKRD